VTLNSSMAFSSARCRSTALTIPMNISFAPCGRKMRQLGWALESSFIEAVPVSVPPSPYHDCRRVFQPCHVGRLRRSCTESRERVRQGVRDRACCIIRAAAAIVRQEVEPFPLHLATMAAIDSPYHQFQKCPCVDARKITHAPELPVVPALGQ